MNNLTNIFKHEEFGQVKFLLIEGNPWFVGKDVAKCLEYSNTNQAILDNVSEEDKIMYDSKTQYLSDTEFDYKELGQRGGWIINESGLYSLIFNSKMPKAKEFKKWVTSEVLPKIRKTGEYSSKPKNVDEMIVFLKNTVSLLEEERKERLLIEKQHEEYKQYVNENKYDRYGKPDYNNKSFRECAKNLGIGSATKLINLLVDKGYGRRIKGKGNKFRPYRHYTDEKGCKGYFHCTLFNKHGMNMMEQWRITPKGYDYLEEHLFR